jgi:hypothetical protein
MSGGNHQNPVPGQNSGGGSNPGSGPDPGGGQNPVGNRNTESRPRSPVIMPDVINDNDEFSPVELMIKRRIYRKLIIQYEEEAGIHNKKYVLSPNFSSAGAVINEDEKELFFKVI